MEPMHPSSSKSFPKTLRTQSESIPFGGSHNYNTKQNKVPSFIDRQEARFFHWHRNINYVPILFLET